MPGLNNIAHSVADSFERLRSMSGASGEAYLKDIPKAEMHRLQSGHFAVEDSLGGVLVEDVASGQQEQRPKPAAARDKPPAGRLHHQLGGVAHEQLVVDARDREVALQHPPYRPITIARRLLGTRMAKVSG
jgi:hypothetical protein